MKLTVFLMLVSFIGVFASGSYSQTTRLTLKVEKVSLENFLIKIEDQSLFRFFYTGKINVDKKVSYDFKNKKITQILDAIGEDAGINYEMMGRHIILSPRNSEKTGSYAMQQKDISGKVTDEAGLPLPGVTVIIKGTTQGTVTDVDGNYTLANVPGDATLVFSFVGMKSQEISVAGKTNINVVMAEETVGIEEVVAIGYGTMKKSDLTGSVASANIKAFQESPNVNIMQSLQGSVPGVQIGQVNRAGEQASISIRGTSTINGNTSPLIVLDGIIYRGELTFLNPSDIESVDILKDASSKAIYGAQAANGVILITTKKGEKDNKPSINYTASHSIQMPTASDARLLNREEYLQKIKDINYKNAYLAGDYLEENPDWNYTMSELVPNNLKGLEDGTDFDWWDALTSPGHIIDHNLSLSGGTENTSYFISGGYTDYEGFIMNDDFQRSSVRINFQSEINPWLTVGANTFGSFTDLSGAYPNMYYMTRTSPLVTPKNENGDFIINPFGDVVVNTFLNAMADDNYKRNNIGGNFFAIVSIPKIEGLTYRINYSNDLQWVYYGYSNEYDNGQIGKAFKSNSSTYNWMLDNILSYEKQINEDHGLKLTFVYGANKVGYEWTKANGINYTNLDLSYNSLQQAKIQNIQSTAWKESSLYQMGRLNYNYKNKYLLTATMRRDGFSGFSKNNKFGWFPSVGLGWVLSEEDFYSIPSLDYLKLRVSYGENGNLTSRYSSLAKVSSTSSSQYVFGDGASTSNGQSPGSLANDDLSWETTTGINFGIDFMALNNRIRGNIEYYRSETTDLLWNMTIPQMTGFSNITTNLGKIANTGLEFAIYTTPVKTSNFTWNLNFNISTNKNEIKELLGNDDDGDGKEDDLVSSGLFIGKSIETIYDYEIEGIWQLDDDIPAGYYPGTYKIADLDGDGKISAATDRKILGKEEPAYHFGIENTLTYNNFSLHFFINSIQGGNNGYLQKNDMGYYSSGNSSNHNWFNFYDYWSPSNPDAKFANRWLSASKKPSLYQSRSFTRLQDVSLSYKLNSSLAKKLGIGDAKFYISGKNLLTFTNWDGWDPETGQTISTNDNSPVMKSYSLGVDILF